MRSTGALPGRNGTAAVARDKPMMPRVIRDTATAPDCPGSYLLLITLDAPARVTLPRRPAILLPTGNYLYAGSAHGPGGLRARISRHQLQIKTVHWHVDQLTTQGRVTAAWLFAPGAECAIAAALEYLPAPISGFGSSDCRRCPSHLRALPDGGSDDAQQTLLRRYLRALPQLDESA